MNAVSYGARRHFCRGFTLIEIAIVVAIMGITIAGIFAAFSVSQKRVTSDQAGEELSLLSTNIRAYYQGQNTSMAALNPPSGFTGTAQQTAPYIAAGVFPPEMITAGNATNPWSGNVYVGLAQDPTAIIGHGRTSVFVIQYQGVPTVGCTDLLSKYSTPGNETNLLQIILLDTNNNQTVFSSTVNTLPIPSATAINYCIDANAPYTIQWWYNIGNGYPANSKC